MSACALPGRKTEPALRRGNDPLADITSHAGVEDHGARTQEGVMSHVRSLKAGLASACLVAALGIAHTAHAKAVAMKFPVSELVLNACTGEELACTFTLHVVTAVTADNAGGSHLSQNFTSSDFRCVSTTGVEYTGQIHEHLTLELPSSGVSVTTNQLQVVLASHGSTPNALGHLLFHTTVHADGEITGFVDKMTTKCTGEV